MLPDRFTAYCFLLPIVGVLLGDRIAAGWLWDWANGFGFAAFSGLIYLSLQGRQRDLRVTHKQFSYAVLALLAIHIVMLLVLDSVVLHYVLPGAPLYMWSGILALLLVLFIVVSAVPANRLRCFRDLSAFRRWHKPLSWALIAAATYHLIDSGFYIRTPLQLLALILLLGPLCLPAKYNDRCGLTAYSPLTFLAVGIATSAILSTALNWPPP